MVTHALGIRFRWWSIIIFAAAILAIVLVTTLTGISRGPDPQLMLQADRSEILAGGASAHFVVKSSLPLPASGLDALIKEGGHSARVARSYFEDGAWRVTVQSKALPGPVKLVVTLPPFVAGSAALTILPNERDSIGDGTPDVLRLDDSADNQAFRSWFAFLAEAQFFRETTALPPEISDCAGLIRYAYREALRAHDNAWAKTSKLPLVPAIATVRKYEYPFTPWGAALFRTGPAALGEFADAGTLLRYNTHLVSRDIRQAQPGDLIFYRQEDAAMPYHSMIFLGPSQIENAAGPFVVYHTGPVHEPGQATISGEVRRPSVAELQKHPDPGWHPAIENPHYLGVYRWNILWR